MIDDKDFERFRILGGLYWDRIGSPSYFDDAAVREILGHDLVEHDPFDGSVLKLSTRDIIWMDMVRLTRQLRNKNYSPTRINAERGAFSKSMVGSLLYQAEHRSPMSLASTWRVMSFVRETESYIAKAAPGDDDKLRRTAKPFLRQWLKTSIEPEMPNYDFRTKNDPMPPEIVAEHAEAWRQARRLVEESIRDL